VCGQTDPFCPHALGARIPDGNAGRSIAYQVRGSFLIGTAAGCGGALILPVFPYCYQFGTSATTTLTWSSTYSAFAAATAFSASVGQWRLVSFGAKIGSVLSATNNGGFLTIGSISQVNSTVVVPDMETDDSKMIPLNTFTGATWISKRLSDYNLYVVPDAATIAFPTTFNNYTGCMIQVVTPGGAQNNAVLVEVVMNLEFTPLMDSVSALLAAKGPVRNDSVLTGVSHLQSNIPATFAKGVEDVGTVIESVVKASPLGMIASIGSELLKAL